MECVLNERGARRSEELIIDESQAVVEEVPTNKAPEQEDEFLSRDAFEPFLLNIHPDDEDDKCDSGVGVLESQVKSKKDLRAKRKERVRRKKERRKKKTGKIQTGAQKKMKRLVNHFVAIQVTNSKVKEQVLEIQNKILASALPLGFGSRSNKNEDLKDEESSAMIFKDAMERLDSLHFTMGVIGVNGKEEIERAEEVVKGCWMKHKMLIEEDPIQLNILGLGHFRHKVLFAKIQNEEHISRLKSIADDLRSEFTNSSIFQAPNPFQPHMTIAKMSRLKTLYKKKIRSFPREIWNDHELHCFGRQPVESLQLLSMTRDPKTNYYKMIADYKFEINDT